MPDGQRILYCRCAYSDVIPEPVRRTVLDHLAAACIPFEPVADLCGAAARRDPVLAEVAASEAPVIVACHERAVRWLFDFAGAPLGAGARILDMRAEAPDDIVIEAIGAADAPCACTCGSNARILDRVLEVDREADWVPWFPVIDRERCTGCRQCLNFCLFGVYAAGEGGRVEVAHPEKCKTNCPACARVCPQGAILFPKHPTAPINGGEGEAAEPVQVDLSEMVRGDVMANLRQRGGGRFSDEADAAAADAGGACACSDQMARMLQRLDVPPEVLDDLKRSPRQG